MPDTLQNKIAFEVAVKIVDEFEAVQVHQDQSKGATRASRPLPLRRKCFHEEAMRFDAGEAVGDGLLLSLLERQSIVKGAGDEVGKCAKKQNLFLGKFDSQRRLDVQNAVQLLGVKHGQGDGGVRVRQERLVRRISGEQSLVIG